MAQPINERADPFPRLWTVQPLPFAHFADNRLLPVARSNPPVTREVQWDSTQIRALAQRACFDCHSNETVWPWYSYIAPISLRVADHVQEGRQKLNFSA